MKVSNSSLGGAGADILIEARRKVEEKKVGWGGRVGNNERLRVGDHGRVLTYVIFTHEDPPGTARTGFKFVQG